MPAFPINTHKIIKAARILRALNHPLRIKILAFIHKNKKTHVNKIYKSLKMEQSITSQHLRILREAGLVDTHRKGKFIIYSINYPKLNSIINQIENFSEK